MNENEEPREVATDQELADFYAWYWDVWPMIYGTEDPTPEENE